MKLALLSVAALAAVPEAFASNIQCTTLSGFNAPKTISTKTSTQTNTIFSDVTKTVQKTVTQTPLRTKNVEVDRTVTHTTTLPISTKTVDKTTTVWTTVESLKSTIKDTTKTAPAVTKTGSQTSTMPSASSFTPAASALSNAQQKRSTVERPGAEKRANGFEGLLHPTAVKCVKQKTITSTRTHTKHKPDATSFARAKTTTITKTNTVKAWKTIKPDPKVTTHVIKKPETSATVRTTTVTKTATVVPTTTVEPVYYAACGAKNLLDYTYSFSTSSAAGTNSTGNSTATTSTSINQVGIASFTTNTGVSNTYTIKNSTAYDCCAACMSGSAKDDSGSVISNCVGTAFSQSGECTLFGARTCTAGKSVLFGTFYGNSTALKVGEGLTVSNGACGGWSYGSS